MATAFVVMIARVQAQPVLEPTSLPFAERLTERVPVSGRTLVGLLSTNPQLAAGDGLSTGSIAVPAPLITRGSTLCVRATTQDGRYSAENSFAVQREVPRTGRAELAWPTHYEATLRTFPLSEVAAVARRGSCADGADIIPIILGAGAELGALNVLVNTRGAAITAAVRDPDSGRTLRRANCTRVPGAARVAFDASCALGAAIDLPARVQLRLEQVSHDGLQVELLENVTLRLAN